jgi:beta-glucuronidase
VSECSSIIKLEIPDVSLGSPADPNLCTLSLELKQGGEVGDSYSLKIGVRTIRVDREQLLLYEKPVYLQGFGRHEDFPVVGRRFLPALRIKDYRQMK